MTSATATEIAAQVRAGDVRPVDVVRTHLDRIAEVDGRIGAFQVLRADAALKEAELLEGRADLAELPLAGVPVAVKDVTRNSPRVGEHAK